MSDFRLRVFSSVAKNLSFTKASQELFISQPAITKHIQEVSIRPRACFSPSYNKVK
ncbi:LysR family transcriptional regulator, partial [Phocaeicola vulgatus]|uniref:LysR family transcriptional regulator n=1 Tax=Phocaeicola vulgatus TaxID=821 RepID=UPI00210DA21B